MVSEERRKIFIIRKINTLNFNLHYFNDIINDDKTSEKDKLFFKKNINEINKKIKMLQEELDELENPFPKGGKKHKKIHSKRRRKSKRRRTRRY